MLFYAKIKEAAKMEEYFSDAGKSKYGSRKDMIYNAIPDRQSDTGWSLKRNKLYEEKQVHTDEQQKKRDAAGGYVLVSEDFSYWGKDAWDIDASFREMLPKRQETKRIEGKNLNELQDYIESISRCGGFVYIAGEPHDPIEKPNCKGCNQK